MRRAVAPFPIGLVLLLQGIASGACAQEFAVVARSIIYPGQMIEPGSLEVVDASNCPNCDAGYIQDEHLVAGRIAVKTLVPGKLIFAQDLRAAPAVMRGQEVKVVYRKGALQISMSGIPLNDAAAGEAVSIRNAVSGAIINGVARTDGTVTVTQ